MKKFTLFLIAASTTLLMLTNPAFADFKLKQKVTMGTGGDGFSLERSIWVKGMRERTANRMEVEDEMMSQMMPQLTEIKQCDLRQTVKINERSKKYYLDPFYISDDKPLPPVSPSTKTETVKGGTVTWTYTLTDTGERRQLFGLTARKLIIKQLSETSKDSCSGEGKMSLVEEGWFVYLIPENAVCQIELPRGEGKPEEKCRDKFVMKGSYKYPGMMLEGKTTMTDLLRNDTMVSSIETLDLSKESLDVALFEIPKGFAEVNSEQSLMSFSMNNIAAGNIVDSSGARSSKKKAVAIDFFSGSVSKINQNSIRQYLASKISSDSIDGVIVMSQNDIASGAYGNVIGVEIKSAKESGASKIGGLFGKVTGNEDGAKVGKSEAEVVVTLYSGDGKTVIASGSAKEKADGKADDAVKAAIDRALSQITPKLK